MKIVFIIPCYNAASNLPILVESLNSQKNTNWSAIIVDDMSEDSTYETAKSLSSDNIKVVKNSEKKYALRNIVDTARCFQDDEDVAIAVIDGDDSLCNENTVSLLIDAYEEGHEAVWTMHRWDINDLNISKKMPQRVDPYSWPWSSSHLRTFKSSLLKKISDSNFKDCTGNWFKRGYDQALMLPVLYVSKSRYCIEEVCYLYNINSVSIQHRNYEEMDQISTVNIVRSRRFID